MLGNILIMGDSYSTYEGMIPKGYATYYSKEGRADPAYAVTKMDVEDTWWMRMIRATDAKLVQNNSWSGSTICYTGWNGIDCSKTSSFICRYRKLKAQGFFEKNEINTVFVFGGTNDSWSNAPLGDEKYSDFCEKDLFCALPAICYFMKTLKEDLPGAKIIFIVNDGLKSEIVNTIKSSAERFGVDAIELHGIEKELGHPNISGMKSICEQILEALKMH